MVERTTALLRRALTFASDKRWFGLTRLEYHIAICGFPRSGSAMLRNMLGAALPHADQSARERAAVKVARRFWPGRHDAIITKRPGDIEHIDGIREVYAGRHACVRFLVCTRDPRSILTSHMSKRPHPAYYVSIERWRSIVRQAAAVEHDDDVLEVPYEYAVTKTDSLHRSIETHIPLQFDWTATAQPRTDRLARWAAPEHRERVLEILRDCTELPDYLIAHGYEPNRDWIDRLFRPGDSRPTI